MIQSGRTKSVAGQLEKWYSKTSVKADKEWIWGFNKKAIQDVLDTRKEVPFRCFMIRYLLSMHEEELHPSFFPDLDGEEWLKRSAEKILRIMENSEEKDYQNSPNSIKKLTDLVFDDFVSNQFYIAANDTVPDKVCGSVNRGIPLKGKKELRPILWDKNDLLRKLKARKLATDFSNRPEYINEDELFAFAFGLNMDYDDISFFLRKALRRSDFNLWNWKEFLLYITYRYAKGDLFKFYRKLREAYEDERNTPKEYRWIGFEGFSTKVIRDQTSVVMDIIEEDNYAVALDENGELPHRMIEYIREYKYLIHTSKDYTRTISSESAKLLESFEKNVSEDIEDARRAYGEDLQQTESERYAQGKVMIGYRPEAGLHVPAGTVFTKIEKKTGREIKFVSDKEVMIPPVQSSFMEVQIELRCIEKEKKEKSPEEQKGYVPGKTTFMSDNVYLTEMSNKSYFKTLMKVKEGETICKYIIGKISAKCRSGKKVPAGTRFYADYEGRRIEFRSLKEIDASVQAEIWVHGLISGEGATKDEIIDCSMEGWRDKFISLGNSKIGFKQCQSGQAVEGGKLYNYLYQPNREGYHIEEALDRNYLRKLEYVLEGTQLSSVKINQIKKKKEKHIKRNDLLTLSFLKYMSEIELSRLDAGNKASDDYLLRYAGFMQETNEILRKCGYYELYAPNPYDALLVCLLTSGEAIDAYRNLWSWYLKNKTKAEV